MPYFEKGARKAEKTRRELAAIEQIRDQIGGEEGPEIYELWQEFEARESAEARFVKALDNLEVQIQHNLADFATWEPVEYDLVYNKMDRTCAHEPYLSAAL